MGYWQEDGRWADTREVSLASGTKTESGVGDAVEVGDRGTLRLTLEVHPKPPKNEIQKLVFSNVDGDMGAFRISFHEDEFSELIPFGPMTASHLQAAIDAAFEPGEVTFYIVEEGEDEGAICFEFHDGESHRLIEVDLSTAVPDDPEEEPDYEVVKIQEAGPGAPFSGKLDVEIETSHDGQTYRSLGSFPQATGPGEGRKVLTGADRFVRASWTLAGATEVTFSVVGEAV